MFSLDYTTEVAARTAPHYEKVKAHIPPIEWPVHAVFIDAIEQLKKKRNALVLAHNYQTPEIFHTVADIVGDSLKLAREARNTQADVIVMCGVHFMAETAKLLNLNKTVLIPDLNAGCSLADAITPEDVRSLRAQHPDASVVTYVNTSAAVKAEADICCTSSNAVEIVESLGSERVIFLPDEYLGRYVASQTEVEIILWSGRCQVHERFTAQELRDYRQHYPGLKILAHPECSPDVLKEADFVGSTSGLSRYVEQQSPQRAMLVTECSMSDNVAIDHPDIEFVRPCALCPHMKRITLEKLYLALSNLQHEIHIPKTTAYKARRSVERMLEVA